MQFPPDQGSTDICRYSLTRKKLGGAFVVRDNNCHASSFETSLGDNKSNSSPSISSVAAPAANTFWTQSESEPYIKMKM